LAVIDEFTLVAGYIAPYGNYTGFRSETQVNPIGTINGQTSNYPISPNWIPANKFASIQKLERGSDPGFTGVRLEVSAYSDPGNSGWYDIRLGSSIYNRVDASSSLINGGYGRDWKWAGSTNPFVNGSSYSIVVTDNGSLGPIGVNIPLGISSGAIDMNTLRNFFGEPTYNSNTIAMSNLYKNGDLVPFLNENSSIPTSGTISLSNFYNANTTLLVDKHPAQKSTFVGFGQTGTAEVVWNQSILPNGESDVDIGYKALKSVLEYRWVINITSTQGSISGLSRIIASGVTSYMSGNSHTTAWGDTMTLILQVDHGLNTGFISGTVYMEARKVWNGSTYTVTTNQAYWDIIIESAGE